jgi:homoserine kinase type II
VELPRTLSSVLARYPLEDPRVVGAFDASTRNDNVRVVDARGGGAVLRRYRRNRDPERARFQIRFQQQLEAGGFPVARTFESTSGETVVVDEEGLPWALFGLVEGEHYDFGRLEHAREAGRRLAELHDVTDRFAEAPRYHLDANLRRFVAAPDEIAEGLRRDFGSAELEPDIRRYERRLEAIADALPPDRFDALPAGWLHDDYHGRNVIFAGDEMVALLDFDKLQRDPRASDIARGVVSFGRERRGSHALRPDFVGAFLAGYRERREISREEIEAMPLLIELAWAPFAAISHMLQADGKAPAAAMRRDLEDMRAAERQGPAILHFSARM